MGASATRLPTLRHCYGMAPQWRQWAGLRPPSAHGNRGNKVVACWRRSDAVAAEGTSLGASSRPVQRPRGRTTPRPCAPGGLGMPEDITDGWSKARSPKEGSSHKRATPPLGDPSFGSTLDDPLTRRHNERRCGARPPSTSPHPAEEPHSHVEDIAPWPGLGEDWPDLHSFLWGIRKSRTWGPARVCRGGSGPRSSMLL